MEELDDCLNEEDAFHAFLKTKIRDLQRDKREVVGVFGETGAGKSSLINAIIGEKNLLPSGCVSACTAVMIKLEANVHSQKYEAEIEFITKEDWEEEVEDLSAKVVKYTRNGSSDEECGEVKRWFWPLVKCVTVRVPSYDLQHVTLVDLPGSGDNNKSRDRMWTDVVKGCSTVWIVTEINRAASEKESWQILENVSGLMGNGGECQQILFICTKSDVTDLSVNDREEIIQRNIETKKTVKNKFNTNKKIKKHFGDECLDVFTVSSKEFLYRQLLEPEDTEIPKLQEFLRNLNDSHSETSKYVSGALGILSVIQGARSGAVPGTKSKVRTELENKLNELSEIRKPIEEAYKAFEKCLTEGVEKSEGSCEKLLKSTINPMYLKTKKGKPININVLLASHLADSVDEEFKKTFPNDRKSEPFDGVVSRFSLGAERLTEKYKGVELQLTFLKTEEKKIKTELNKIIREEKKKIYNSLTETIQDSMQGCYKEAAGFTGAGTLEKMRNTLEKHVCDSKNVMFKQAKYSMLEQLKELMKKLEKTLKESIELSLKTDEHPLPDVSAQLKLVKSYYNQLKGEPDQTEVDDVDTEASRDQTSPSGENLERNVPAEISADERLLAVRTQFIDSVSESVLKSLLDELLQHRVITDEEMQSARKNTKAKTAREVIDMVRRKGSKASRVLITALCKVDPFLSKELKLM
ncbi:hypothetical protein Q5P01_000144 [Channa striata]|uniref:CARD domain-containing protein n=1 Tax=Channa striata TaxID=64152 RepID=A0AA88IHN9_CHASR|nr:hypothetical protein Q5P01_000144 [Channa striata]